MNNIKSYQAVGHLVQFFNTLDKLTDDEINRATLHLDWEAPDIILTRWSDESGRKKEASTSMIWPVQSLLRCDSDRVRRLLLKPHCVPSSSERVYLPDLERNRQDDNDFWEVALKEAMARSDIESLVTLTSFRSDASVKNVFVWQMDRLPILELGIYDACKGVLDEQKIKTCLDFFINKQLELGSDIIRSYKWKGTARKKKIQFKKDMLGCLLIRSVENNLPELADFYIKQGAVSNTLTLQTAVKNGNIPIIELVLKHLRNQEHLQESNFSFIQTFTHRAYRRTKESFSTEAQANENTDKVLIERIEGWVNNYLFQKRDGRDAKRLPDFKKNIEQILFYLMEDGLIWPGKSEMDRSKWAASMALMAEDLGPRWIDLLDKFHVEPSELELSTLLTLKDTDVFEHRTSHAISLGITFKNLDKVISQKYLDLNPELEVQMRDLIIKNWKTIDSLQTGGINSKNFCKKCNMDSDTTTWFLLQLAKQNLNPTENLSIKNRL